MSDCGPNIDVILICFSGILDVEVLPAPTVEQDRIQSWDWKIKNKYYTADIQLVSIVCAESHKEWILNNCEALIIYCDSTKVKFGFVVS